MTSIYDVLKASKGIHVDDTFAELWGRKLSNAYTVETYIGTLPATLQTVEGYLESYKIYGNTVQDGTPTPENPIMPIGCGERTENFWNFQPSTEQSGVTLTWNGAKIVFSGICTTSSNLTKTITLSAGTYTIKANANRIPVENDNSCVDVYKASPYMMAKITNRDAINGIANFTLGEETTVFLRIRVQADVNYDGFTLEPMLNLGSTPLPYEPYGYKLPLTVNDAEYPIYLNEPLCGIGTYTDSLELSTGILTRKIKKLALTGKENWNTYQTSYYITVNNYYRMYDVGSHLSVCSHYPISQAHDLPGMSYGLGGLIDGKTHTRWNGNIVFNPAPTISSRTDWQSYLAQQYTAGTPVTVWYVLAEPEISTIPVPSGLTGTIEGYLIQDGTPTPETPIYPTANGVKQADGTYIIPYSVEYPIYLGDAQLAKDEYVDSTTGNIYRRTKNLSPPEEEWMDEWIWGDGTIHPSTEIKTSPFIDVSTCETCIMEVFSAETEWAEAGYREVAFYDANKQYLGWIGGGGRQALTPNSSERLSEFPAGTVYVRISCSHDNQPFYPQLVSGYTPTHQFYPYLVPTDPPAPFPQIPTSAGSTTISWAGEGLAPSGVELTYRKPKGQ